ncbi:hypothetical protein JVT61DRAFT_9890 [Boletus reticuloceps]|uniref:Uncharacterized protein n=1 Tax=Boletus reticuloceps TaxID=495285 RepID=A0A8I2YGM3_9AGAM|nr:hypothetical protein JVT61DRAFT_9890 [Boletus reticuloceps]
MLMYYDKRFQLDETFALIAFNHEQIKAATTSGFLMTKRNIFSSIINRIFSLNLDTLNEIVNRLHSGLMVSSVTESEKECFQLMQDLDIIGRDVNGSLTSKCHMHNEI